jgi:hypothetical protein
MNKEKQMLKAIKALFTKKKPEPVVAPKPTPKTVAKTVAKPAAKPVAKKTTPKK